MGLHVKGCVCVFFSLPVPQGDNSLFHQTPKYRHPFIFVAGVSKETAGYGISAKRSSGERWNESQWQTKEFAFISFPLYLNVSRELQGAKLSTKHDVSLLLISPSLNPPRPPSVAKYLSVPKAASALTLLQRGWFQSTEPKPVDEDYAVM